MALNKSERRYTITNPGKLVLSLARQIEESGNVPDSSDSVNTKFDPKCQNVWNPQKPTQHYAAKKAWQTIRKNQMKLVMIDFLSLNPESRNGDILKHIQADKKT